MIVLTNGETPVATTYGVDASHWQFGNGLTIATIARNGYDFVMLKCTQGTGWTDPTYRGALAAAQRAGLLVAAYHFLEHGNTRSQALHLAAHIVDKRVPVAIDCEPTGKSRPTMTDLVEFKDACASLGLKVTMKYVPHWYWESMGRPNLDGPLALWSSSYPSSAHAYGSVLYPGDRDHHWGAYGNQVPTIWQFASSGKLDGFVGNVDVNAYRGTRSQLAATGLFHDYGVTVAPPPPPTPKPQPKPPKPVPTTMHTHLQLNVQRTMSQADITADLTRAFALAPDTVVFNEMETDWHHAEAARLAVTHGYSLFTPAGAGAAVVVAVRKPVATVVYEKSVFCAPGKSGLSPNRYFNRVQIQRKDTGEKLAIGGTHMWSSGWTGAKVADTLRQSRWYMHMGVMYPTFRRTTRHNHVSIGSGDLNRPPSSWPSGKVLSRMLNPSGLVSVGYAHTDGTHGAEIFDYTWWASKHVPVTLKDWSTPAFKSDHDGVLVTLTWPTSKDAVK